MKQPESAIFGLGFIFMRVSVLFVLGIIFMRVLGAIMDAGPGCRDHWLNDYASHSEGSHLPQPL